MPPAGSDYGSDTYWVARYERGDDDALTDEWLLGWAQLRPLLARDLSASRDDPSVLDLGCGRSHLCFDLLRDHPDAIVRAMDLAPAAIAALAQEQRSRVRRGDACASRATLECADATSALSWRDGRTYDAVVDKSTTDGLLCDVRRGAKRVRTIYEAIGRRLRPTAVVAVVSWRDPDEVGLEWLVDCVLGALRRGARADEDEEDEARAGSWWSLDIHSLSHRAEGGGGGGGGGPHVYLVRRRPKRKLRRRAVAAAAGAEEAEEDISVRHHVHDG